MWITKSELIIYICLFYSQLYQHAQKTATMSFVEVAVQQHVQTWMLPQTAMPHVWRRVCAMTALYLVAPSVSPRLSVAACMRDTMWRPEPPSWAVRAAPNATRAPLVEICLLSRQAAPLGSSARWWGGSEVAIPPTTPLAWYLVTHILWPLMGRPTTSRALVLMRWLVSPIRPAWSISVLFCRTVVKIRSLGLLSSWWKSVWTDTTLPSTKHNLELSW